MKITVKLEDTAHCDGCPLLQESYEYYDENDFCLKYREAIQTKSYKMCGGKPVHAVRLSVCVKENGE